MDEGKTTFKKGKARLVTSLLTVLCFFVLLFNSFVTVTHANPGYPSAIGTSTLFFGFGTDSYQGSGFATSNRFWIFYGNGTDILYKTSLDQGESWGSATSIFNEERKAYEFDIRYNGSHMHMLIGSSDASPTRDLLYRLGVPQADGNIIWETGSWVSVLSETNAWYQDPCLRLDSNGYVYIGYGLRFTGNSTNYPAFIKNNWKNGSWSMPSGFPIQLDTEVPDVNYYFWYVVPARLDNGEMYIIKQSGNITNTKVQGRIWNGTAWKNGWHDVSDYESDHGAFITCRSDSQGNVYMVYNTLGGSPPLYEAGHLRFNSYDYNTGSWGTERLIAADHWDGHIMIDYDRHNLFLIFRGDWGSANFSRFYYIRYNYQLDTWGTIVDWFNATNIRQGQHVACTTWDQVWQNYMAVSYACNQSTPYTGEFNALDVTPSYKLSLQSSPSPVSFTLNGSSETTPYSNSSLLEGAYKIVFPSFFIYQGENWTFAYWNDNLTNTNPERTITLLSNTSLSVTYSCVSPIFSPPTAMQFWYEGDLFGFFASLYGTAFGTLDVFVSFVAFLVCMALFIRTKSLILLTILSFLVLGTGLMTAMPLASGLGVLLMIFGIAGLLHKVYAERRY